MVEIKKIEQWVSGKKKKPKKKKKKTVKKKTKPFYNSRKWKELRYNETDWRDEETIERFLNAMHKD